MKVYVAGKTNDFERVRRVQECVRRFGHEITFDWTQTVETLGPDACTTPGEVEEETKRECAENDKRGTQECDLLIALVDFPGLSGTLIEIGMAIALDKEVWAVGEPERRSVFYSLPQVKNLKSELDIVNLLPVLP